MLGKRCKKKTSEYGGKYGALRELGSGPANSVRVRGRCWVGALWEKGEAGRGAAICSRPQPRPRPWPCPRPLPPVVLLRAGTLGKGEEPSPRAGRRRRPISAIVVTNADQ